MPTVRTMARALAAMLVMTTAALAQAAAPPPPADPTEVIAPKLPAPPVNEDAPPAEFLLAARNAITANRLDEAQESLERAESRALDRAVRPSKAQQPSAQPLVKQISAARQALGQGDRARALELIAAALRNPDAQGK